MKRFALALVALVLLALAPVGAARAEPLYVAETDDGYLNLRTGPGTNYGVVLRLTAGIGLQGLASQGSWRQVALPDGRAGWASSRYLAPYFNPFRNYDYAVLSTNDGYLNLRAGPGTSSGVVRRLYAGQRLFALNWSNGWVQLQLPDGTTGWASERYLTPI